MVGEYADIYYYFTPEQSLRMLEGIVKSEVLVEFDCSDKSILRKGIGQYADYTRRLHRLS